LSFEPRIVGYGLSWPSKTRCSSAYERKIADLETRKLLITEKLQNWSKPQYAFDDLFQRAMEFLSSLWNLWKSGQTRFRRPVLCLAFAERVPYRRGKGFPTPKRRYRSTS
jgi:hypothetical protein